MRCRLTCASAMCRRPTRSIAAFASCRPGTILRASRRQRAGDQRRIGRSQEIAAQGQSARFRGSEDEAVEALDALLRDAVRRRMIADVPLGAFLSGGIDSSTVVALMQAQSARPVRTFSIGFHEAEYQRERARRRRRAASRHRPHRALCRAATMRSTSSRTSPTCTTSRSPTRRRSRPISSRKMTREHVTVALSGDGGDELFAGYTRYFRGARSCGGRSRRRRGRCARSPRAASAALPPAAWTALGDG